MQGFRESTILRIGRTAVVTGLVTGVAVGSICRLGFAQPTPAATPAEPPPMDEAAIQAALQADARSAAPPAPATATPVAAGTGSPTSDSLFNPAISVIPAVALAVYSNDALADQGGHVPPFSGLHLEVVEVAISGSVDPYFRVDLFPALTPEGFELEEAYATTLGLPANLELKAGHFLTPFGRLNTVHAHRWSFVDPPAWRPRMLSGEGLRSPGASLNLLLPLPFYLKLIGTAQQPAVPPALGEINTTFTEDATARYRMLYSARIEAFVPFGDAWSALAGVSIATAPSYDSPAGNAALYGADLHVRFKPVAGSTFFEVSWTTEAVRRHRPRTGEDWGLSSEILVRFLERWYAAVRYDWLAGSQAAFAETPPQERGAISIAHRPTEFSQIRVQYGVSAFEPQPSVLLHEGFVQAQFDLGAHGAHPF